MEFSEYLKELLNIDLTDLVQAEEGDYVSKDMVFMRFQITDGKSEEVKSLVCDHLGEMADDFSKDMIPGYQGHEIAEKLKSEELLGTWFVFLSGSGQKKTRSVEVYLTEDEEGTYYLYFFG